MSLLEPEGNFSLGCLLLQGLGPVWWWRVQQPDISRCVEFQRDIPCPTEHARSDRVGVYDACGDRAVAMKEIQAQFTATQKGTERMDYAAVATHFDGLEISRECKRRIQAPHEEGH